MTAAGLVDAIDALLPQTQCTKCGFPACRPYAEAVARGEADIDRCSPGGTEGVRRLARLLGRAPKPLDPRYGCEQPRAAAFIREEWCIGCALCIQACPVDAIIGAPKQMHTVLIAECTGCELCIPPCPVDCIELLPLRELAARGSGAAAAEAGIPLADRVDEWRARYTARQARLEREEQERAAHPEAKAQGARSMRDADSDAALAAKKSAAIEAALQRARARRLGQT